MVKGIGKVVWGMITILGVILALHAWRYVNFDPSYGFLQLKKKAIATGWYLPAYYSHVLISALILVIGFFQVSNIGRNWIRVHRALGRVYVFGILFLAAPGGLVMAFFINRGPWVLTSFLFQVAFWFLFTTLAFDSIRKKRIDEHRAWMLRSFALTCAAITLRLYIFLTSLRTLDLTYPAAYATIAWLSWVPNLLFAEVYLRSFRPARPPGAK